MITAKGRRIGVIIYRDGHRELTVFDQNDPDSCTVSIPMADAEASALSELLGVSVVLSKLTELTDDAAGLFTEHLLIPNDSVYAGNPLGDTKARTRTGVSIVALVRDKKVIPSPTPQEKIEAGDALIAVGTRSGLDALSELIAFDTV